MNKNREWLHEQFIWVEGKEEEVCILVTLARMSISMEIQIVFPGTAFYAKKSLSNRETSQTQC